MRHAVLAGEHFNMRSGDENRLCICGCTELRCRRRSLQLVVAEDLDRLSEPRLDGRVELLNSGAIGARSVHLPSEGQALFARLTFQ